MMDMNIYNIEKKFPYKKKYYKDFSPVRSACLFVVKALTKLVEEMHNTVYFDFDQDGLILRATDIDALSKAKQRLEYWKDQTQIGILTDYIDKEDYKKFIDNELQGLWKREKAFINVISYDKFYAACEFLEKKGYLEPQKKYYEIMQQNKNFSLLMCTKHRFEEIKSTIAEILQPLRTDAPPQKNNQKKTSAPIAAHSLSSGNLSFKQSSLQKPISTTNQTMNKYVQKPVTWDDESSDSYEYNQGVNSENQSLKGINVLDIDQKNSFYDNLFPDIGSGNANNDYDPMFPQLQQNQKNTSNNNKIQIIDSISKPTSTDTDQNLNLNNKIGKQSNNKDTKDVGRQSFDYDQENEDFNKPQSFQSNSQEQSINSKEIMSQKNDYQYESKDSSINQNYGSVEQKKYNFQLKFIVWLIYSGIMDQNIFQNLKVEEDSENEQFVILSVNKEKENLNQQEIESLEKKISYFESLTEVLQMNVILNLWPIETYQYIKMSNFFLYLSAEQLDFIDLITVESFKKSVLAIKNNMIQTKSAMYLFQKMTQKKNFCFLVAPRKIFFEIRDKIIKFFETIKVKNIQNLYIDTYQQLVDYFPFQNIKKSKLQEIDNYYSNINKKNLNNSQQETQNIQSNNKNNQQFIQQQQQQQQQQQNQIKPLYKVNNNNILYVKKFKNQNEYDLLKICKNLRIQNFYQSSYIIQQFGIKVVQHQTSNSNNNQQYSNIGDIYVFYENKLMNIQKAIQQKMFKTPKSQLKAAEEVIEAVKFLHTHVLRPRPHGNIKPENILCDKQNEKQKYSIQLTDIIHDEVGYSKFHPPEYFMNRQQIYDLQQEKFQSLSNLNMQCKQLQSLYQQQQQLQIQQNQLNIQKNNRYNNKNQMVNMNKSQLQQYKSLINNILQANVNKQSKVFEQFLQNQNFIQKQQYNLLQQKSTFEADIWAIGLIIYSIFTGEITDTHAFILKGRQKLEQVILESVNNNSNNNNIQKQFLKYVLKLVDEIMQFEPENRPNIFEVLDKITTFSEQYEQMEKKD